MKLLISLSSDMFGPPMARPALACSAVRAGLVYRKDDPSYEGTINILGTAIRIAHRDRNNWFMEMQQVHDRWRVNNMTQAMADYYDIGGRPSISDVHAAQIINHFFKEKPHAGH